MKHTVVFLCLCISFITGYKRVVIHTSEQIGRLYEFFPLRTNVLKFSVRARNDIHVALTDGPALTPPYYEIVIGGWENTKSTIRKDNDDNRVEYVNTIIKPNQFQTFSVVINEMEGSIEVGQKLGDVFMYFKDPEFVKMSYFGISTGFGSKGEWHFDFDMFYCGCNTCNISTGAQHMKH